MVPIEPIAEQDQRRMPRWPSVLVAVAGVCLLFVLVVLAVGTEAIIDTVLAWLPAILAALACGLMTCFWAFQVLIGATKEQGATGDVHDRWLPGWAEALVNLAAIAVLLLPLAGAILLVGPSADPGRALIVTGSVAPGLVVFVLVLLLLGGRPEAGHRFCVGCQSCRPSHLGACGGRLNDWMCESCGATFIGHDLFADLITAHGGDTDWLKQADDIRHPGSCGGRVSTMPVTCQSCGTILSPDDLRAMYRTDPLPTPRTTDVLFRSGLTWVYATVLAAAAGVVVTLAAAGMATAEGSVVAVLVGGLALVAVPVGFLWGLAAALFSG